MKNLFVAVSTVLLTSGLVGATAPAQAHPIVAEDAHAATTESVAQGTVSRDAAHASRIERELYLVPAGIGDSPCRNGTLQYGISLDALPNVARSMEFRTTVPRRGVITFDDLYVDQYNGKAWYSACVSKRGYKVIAGARRLKVTGKDVATGRKVTARKVKVYVTEC